MGTMTVLIIVMKTTVLHGYLERALPISLPVPTTAASLIPGVVTLITTVGTVQMKLTAVSVAIEDVNLKLIGFAMRHDSLWQQSFISRSTLQEKYGKER